MRIALLLAVLVVGPLSAVAQEWTRFRGPNGSGISEATTIPTVWTEDDYRWKTELPGIGHASPVVWGDKVFVTSALEDSAERIVLCLSADTGEILWQRNFPSSVHHKHLRNSFASSTPAVDAHHVYVSWTSPEEYTLIALDHAGRDAWKLDLGPFESQHSGGTSPIVYDDLVILGNDQDGPSFLTAVRAKDGETVWRTPRTTKEVAYATPCVLERPGQLDLLIFDSGAHGISGIDPRSGETQWELGVFNLRAVSSPIIADGLIIGTCGSGAGKNTVAAIRPGPEPEEVYTITDQAPYVPTPLAKDGLLFLWSDKGIAACAKAETGEIMWRERVGGNYSGSPVWINGYLYCLAEDGACVVLRAADEFEEPARNELGEDSRSTPAVAGGVMFLRTYSHLIAIGGK